MVACRNYPDQMEPARIQIAPAKMHAWRSFLTAHAAVVDALSKDLESAVGLPLTWYEVLLILKESDDGRLRMHELAASLLLSRSAATRFIDRMEAAGLVSRESCVTDGRGTFVVMTDHGGDVFRRAAPVHLAGIDRYFTSNITTEEASDVAESFQRVLDGLGS
jgi:DNA-binding MarR family transcriptional regulator